MPNALDKEDLKECHDFIDQFNDVSGKISEAELRTALDLHAPTNDEIMERILSKGTTASPEKIYESIKDVGNLRKLKGKLLQNPFTAVLAAPPISMTRLDAKFISQMYDNGISADGDSNAFMDTLGVMIPPEDGILKMKKAIVGNDLDLEKMFAKYPA